MSVIDIVDAVSARYTVWRTLRGIEPVRTNGSVSYVTGNAAVTFTVRHEGEIKMLKCYTRTNPYLHDIYGSKFYPRELCVIDIFGTPLWVDCLLYDRIEGITLDEALCRAECCDEVATLAASFDRMACKLLDSPVSHGDLKPDNIIVTPQGEMHAIDYDSAFIPAFAGRASAEVGTAAYQHPLRDSHFFDEHLDDYSIAIISTLLHIAARDYSVVEFYRSTHENPLLPHDIVAGRSSLLDQYTEEFAIRGDALRYRIALMLKSAWPRLFNLNRTLHFAVTENLSPTTNNAQLEQENGLWGCRNDEGWIIPPLYDSGFDPTEGFMVATLGGYTHIISVAERVVVHSFDKGITAKPVTNGEVVIRNTDGSRMGIALEALLH